MLGDGIVVTGNDRLTPSAMRYRVGDPVARMPPRRAARECLILQAQASPLSLFSRLFGIDPLAREARRTYSGALAELAVTRSLAGLGSEWTVLHCVTVADGGSDDRLDAVVDHLVIGPAGIFAVTTHSHAGQAVWVGERTFLVDDIRLDHLASAEIAASAASERLVAALAADGTILDAVVTACIVVDAPSTLRIRQRPGRIQVVTARAFASWLTGLPRLISPMVVDAIATVAVDSSTWPISRETLDDHTSDQRHRVGSFEQLRRRVETARIRRLIWTGIGVVISCALAISSVGGLSLFGITTAISP